MLFMFLTLTTTKIGIPLLIVIAVKIIVASVETSLKCLSSIDLGILYAEIQQLESSLQVFIQRTLTLSLGVAACTHNPFGAITSAQMGSY
ncbi:MAG TPA: hypothetical protein DCY70_00495 [Shewanella sp.]|nr:hypothetical protein [Shewanella sp.]